MLSSSFSSPTRAQRAGGKAAAAASPGASSQAALTPSRAVATPARAPPAAPAGPELRGLSGEMPTLWRQLDFTPEGQGPAATPAQAHVLRVIAGSYDLAPGSSVGPVSGMGGEERLLAAYYAGRLRLLPGCTAPPLACSLCTQGHLPSECPTRLAKARM